MKRFWIASLLVGMALSFVPGQGAAQQATSTPSLGDVARQLRAQRKKPPQKGKVFTNDNLPTHPQLETVNTASGTSATPSGQKESTTEAKSSEGGHDEAYYRARAKDLQDQLELHQRELSVLEQKLSQGQTAYYSDPQKTLQQESTPAFQSDVNKLRDEIDKKKQKIADDQKAIDDLRDQLRHEGGDAAWVR
jgi:hypothetical protein